ncbi:MAG: phosphoglycerate kinase, partial [Rhodomicrobium sp.]
MLKSDSPSLHRGQSPGLRRPPRGFPPACVEQIGALKLALDAPHRPVAAIVGGSKVSTKIDGLGHLAKKVDFLIIGGGMVNTFFVRKGQRCGEIASRAGSGVDSRRRSAQGRRGRLQDP